MDDSMNVNPGDTIRFAGSGSFNLEDRQMVQGFVDRYGIQSCEYNFVNLFSWQEVYNYRWFAYEGRLLIYDGVNHCMFMPLGEPFEPESLFALSHHLMNIMELSPNICLATSAYIDAYPRIRDFYTVAEDRDAAEYIYLTRSLAELKGNKLHKKRNLVSQFKRRYPDFRILPINDNNRSAVKAFSRDLLLTREPVPRSLQEEYSAMEKTFAHWDDLKVQGLLLTVEDKIAAFSVFSRLNADTVNVHFEKANIAFKGAAQVINQETALYLADKVKYINREQDLGIAGLRQAKLSYEPRRLITPFLLKLKTNA
ncbi:MAG: phosphatidylglycerol lysyltransferase domain-containing protein [Desulfobacterales bacterium]|nr:phosphatidylglycerol lysyltransferase domain-containing protein [Desulfobacterales bacterium]